MAAPSNEFVLSEAPSLHHHTATATTSTTSSNGGQSTSPRHVGSDNDTVDKLKRKRQPRNSACQSCAALKMKCITISSSGVCERCSRMSRDCIPAVPKPRKRRATDGFEPRGVVPLADLLDLPRTSPSKGYIPQPDVDFGDRAFMRLFAQGLSIDDRAAEYLLRGIDHSYIRYCCAMFSNMAMCFPFVSIPFTDPQVMVTRRPLTTIAICTVASAAQTELQSRLGEAFRHSLATRCIMEGERSIDLMVGLLIYLAWHHQYYRKQQVYQNMCLLAGMASDLGLQKIPSLAERARDLHDQEIQKAFIGVYYLTTSLSIIGFSKPAPLTWCQSLDHFASSLYSSTSREVNLQPYLDLAHLLEDHTQLLAAAPPVQSASYIDLATKSALSRLKTLKRIHPAASSMAAFAAATIHINARSLTTTITTTNLPGSALMQTAVAVKDYLDELLLRPSLTLHHIAIVDWTNLLEVLILTTRLSSPHFLITMSKLAGGLGWESSALASMLQPDAVLDAVCVHMAAAPNDSNVGPRHEGLLSWLKGVCENMKRKIAQERDDDESCFETVSNLDRARKSASAGYEEGRFRAVNAARSAVLGGHIAGPGSWSPFVPDYPFDIGGTGLLDESFWAAFSDFGR